MSYTVLPFGALYHLRTLPARKLLSDVVPQLWTRTMSPNKTLFLYNFISRGPRQLYYLQKSVFFYREQFQRALSSWRNLLKENSQCIIKDRLYCAMVLSKTDIQKPSLHTKSCIPGGRQSSCGDSGIQLRSISMCGFSGSLDQEVSKCGRHLSS
jgi:hypothetical protein